MNIPDVDRMTGFCDGQPPALAQPSSPRRVLRDGWSSANHAPRLALWDRTTASSLDVDVTLDNGSGSTAQRIASKATEFGFSDGSVIARSMNS